MDFINQIIAKDKLLLVYLNNLGTPQWNFFWKTVTNLFNWIPLYFLIAFLIIKAKGIKQGIVYILALGAMVGILDQLTNFVKASIKRLRPSHDPAINETINVLHHSGDYGFYSGHATVSTAIVFFTILLLKKHYKAYLYILILFPLIFSYSRIYLGVHFPLDILTGMLVGSTFGFVYFKFIKYIVTKKKIN